MKERVLSIFIDESGDFGQYNPASPNYYVAMVLHNQEIDISKNINALRATDPYLYNYYMWFLSKYQYVFIFLAYRSKNPRSTILFHASSSISSFLNNFLLSSSVIIR